MDKYIGTLLDDRYEIKELIGTGGMANVYKAFCTRLGRNVAIKILKDEFARDPEFKRRFKNESNAVARLSHKNIVNVYDISNSRDVDYIAMELIEGITLKEYLYKKERLDWKQTLFFAYQIAEGLEHAHSRGIIHQDIKPHNIMLLRDGTLKVADFGIAKLENEGETKVIKEAIGSVHYISPEQAKGGTIDSKTDIYSLGVVMYEMITGRTPFKGDSAVAIVMQHLNALPAPPSSLIDDEIPKAFEFVIEKAMCPSLKRRYQSASELMYDLDKIKENPNVALSYEDFEDTSEIDKTQVLGKEDIKEAIYDSRKSDSRRMDIDIMDNTGKTDANGRSSRERVDNSAVARRKTQQKRDKKRQKAIAKREKRDDDTFTVWGSIMAGIISIAIVCGIVYVSGQYVFDKVFNVEIVEVLAPSLVGQLESDVLKKASLSQYNIQVSEEVYDDLPEGTILSQEPEINELMNQTEIIYITISKGPKTTTVPNIIGYEFEQAELEFTRKNLNYVQEKKYSEDVKEGIVISTIPAVGETVNEGSEITVYVSAGAEVEIVYVPDLDGLTLAKAQEALEAEGLILGNVDEQESIKTENTVIAQGIKTNTETISGTTVDVVVAVPIPEPEVVEVTKTVTIGIPLVTHVENLTMEVYADNELIHKQLHAVNDGSFTLSVTGVDSKTLYVYADGDLVDEIIVRFN